MADQMTMPPQWDPTQLLNPYSLYAKTALPRLSQYVGAPTDATGKPIQSYADTMAALTTPGTPGTPGTAGTAGAAGTTLNSTTPQWTPELQALYSQSQPTATPSQGGMGVAGGPTFSGGDQSNNNSLRDMIKAAGGEAGIRGQMANWKAGPLGNGQQELNQWTAQQAGATPGAAGTAGTPGTPGHTPTAAEMSQAYISALANPGPPSAVGANVPAAAAPTGQSNVLDQFLANWQKGGQPTTGAGNYNNAGFFNALRGAS